MRSIKFLRNLKALLAIGLFGSVCLLVIKSFELNLPQGGRQETTHPIAAITSHHLLAEEMIDDLFQKIGSNQIKTVYLVGPDHFEYLPKLDAIAVTSNTNWQTPSGQLEPDLTKIEKLLQHNQNDQGIKLNQTAFKTEHSITTLIPFVKKYFTNSTIVPIIVTQTKDYNLLFSLGDQLGDSESVMIISSDFSHQASLNQSQTNDQKSIEVLKSLDLNRIDEITCDCKACIAILFGYLNQNQTQFILKANQTSADYGETNLENLTSYVSGYYGRPTALF